MLLLAMTATLTAFDFGVQADYDYVTVSLRTAKANSKLEVQITYNGGEEYNGWMGIGEKIHIDAEDAINGDFYYVQRAPRGYDIKAELEPDDVFQIGTSAMSLPQGRIRAVYDSRGNLTKMVDSLTSLYVLANSNSCNMKLYFTRLKLNDITLTPSAPRAVINNFLGSFTFVGNFSAVSGGVQVDITVNSNILGNGRRIMVFPYGATSFAFNLERIY